MDAMSNYRLTTTFNSSCALLIFFSLLCRYCDSQKEFQVGVLLDMGSWNGKMVHSCITMAASDFYNLNAHYKTRIVPQTIDSEGDPLQPLETVIKNAEAMIVGPKMSLDAKLLAVIADKDQIPVFSLDGSASFSEKYPNFLKLTHSEAMQFEAIATLVESFRWKTVIFLCEDTEYKPGVISNIFKSFQEKHVQIDYISSFPSTANDDEILEELQKLMTMQTKLYVLHMAISLASRLVTTAKSLGMLNEGHAWILTDKTRTILQSMNSVELVQSMQGALALKPYVPPSVELQNFTTRWRKEFQNKDPSINVKELSAYGLWAYDATWALARAVEAVDNQIDPKSTEEQKFESNSVNAGPSQIGDILLNELKKTRFTGLSGNFQIVNRAVSILKAFEIVNFVSEGERRVGFWKKGVGIIREKRHPDLSDNDLEVIIWPGGSITTPGGAWSFMRMNTEKLRVGITNNRGFDEFASLEYDPQTDTFTAMGFCVEVFEAALKALPYEVPTKYIPVEEDTYDSVVYQIYLEKYDAIVGDTAITYNRSQYADFTTPYTDIGVGTIARVKSYKDIWIFTKPVSVNLCLTTAVFFIITGIVIWVIEKPVNKAFQGSLSKQLGTIFFSTLFFGNRENLSSNLSKFVMLTWSFLVLILTSSYTATLTSMLTVQQIELASKGANVGYQSGSLVARNIVSNLNYTDYSLRPYSSAKDYADALSKGSKNGGVDGIIDEIPYIKSFLSKYSPEYAMVDSAATTNGFGFAFQKGSPLVTEISREIMKLREDGTIQNLEEKWYSKPKHLVNQETLPQPQVLGVYNFGGLFLITGVSLSLALFVIIFYFIRKKLNLAVTHLQFRIERDACVNE